MLSSTRLHRLNARLGQAWEPWAYNTRVRPPSLEHPSSLHLLLAQPHETHDHYEVDDDDDRRCLLPDATSLIIYNNQQEPSTIFLREHHRYIYSKRTQAARKHGLRGLTTHLNPLGLVTLLLRQHGLVRLVARLLPRFLLARRPLVRLSLLA